MEGNPISILACAIIGAVSFGVAFILGLIVERSLFSLLINSLLSAVLMMGVFYLLHWIINRYLPELLIKKEDSSLEQDTKQVDIIIDSDKEDLYVPKEYIEPTSTVDNSSFSISDHVPIASKIDEKKEKFYQENPENLAKMVRTSLMKDDK